MAKRALCLIIYFSLFSISACSNNIDKAESFIKVKMYDKAEAILKKALDDKPNNVRLYLALGKVYLLQENPDEANRHFQAALDLEKDCRDKIVDQYLSAIQILYSQGQQAIAQDYLKSLLEELKREKYKHLREKIHQFRKENHIILARQLTFDNWDLTPVWHPTEKSIVFARDKGPWKTFQINLQTNEISPFPHPNNISNLSEMEWSRNGQHIVFWENGTGQDKNSTPNIWRYDLETSKAYPITFSRNLWNYNPCWANDSQIVFDKCDNGDNHEIWTINQNGNEERKLTKGSTPNCSPKGKWLIYKSHDNEHVASDILAFNLETSETLQLTSDDKTIGADLSPDEKRIVFVEIIRPEERDTKTRELIQPGKYKIIIADFPSMQHQNIVFQADGYYGCIPRWSPSGDQIAFCHGPGWGQNSIWLIDL